MTKERLKELYDLLASGENSINVIINGWTINRNIVNPDGKYLGSINEEEFNFLIIHNLIEER